MVKHSSRPWYVLSVEDVLSELATTRDGLSNEETNNRLQQYGRNYIESGKQVSLWNILVHQIASPLIYILLAALAITLIIQHWADAIVIGAVIALNTVIGFIQEYRAENAMQALINLSAPKATVLRNGTNIELDAGNIVPGDIVLLDAGDVVPADLRLIESTRLQVNESLLTGESVPSAKITEPYDKEEIALADQENLAFMGTSVTSGRGIGVCVATGHNTQMGAIAKDIMGTRRTETPLQVRVKRFGRLIAFAFVGAAAIAFAVGLSLGEPLVDMFLTAVSLAVSAIPEGLPVVISVALAIGVRRMASRHAIVRRLPAVESLGSCTVIMSDKTGTLTQNQMTVQSIWTAGSYFHIDKEGFYPDGSGTRRDKVTAIDEGTPLYLTLLTGVMANEASLKQKNEEFDVEGDPTETALLVSGATGGIFRDNLLEDYPLQDEIPFDPNRRFSATIHTHKGKEFVFMKGAVEQIVRMCKNMAGPEQAQELDSDKILQQAESMASTGLRVLAMAMGEGAELSEAVRQENPGGLTFVGLQGMMDPPREEAKEAVAACHRAGIRVVMVTGDNPVTAVAIAQIVGISKETPEVRTGVEIDKLSDEELKEVIRKVSVYARTSPSQKLRLVKALQQQGEIIAVTGDGVNDAPALKSAHIGAAMGRSGTDVAKEASEMVVTDDNFATIYAAVEEGRTSFANIRKATFFTISSGIGEIIAILASLAMRLPLPLLPAQILWLNLVTNGVQDVGLAFEPAEKEQFLKPPRDPKEGLLTRLLIERGLIVGFLMAAGTLGVFILERESGAAIEYARVAALTTLVMFQIFHVFNSRSENQSVFRKNPFSNRFLFIGTLLSVAIHIGAMYFEPTKFLLRVEPLSLETWVRLILIALSIIVVVELHKLFRRTS